MTGGSTITVNSAVKIYSTGDIDLSGGNITNTTALPSDLSIYCGGSSCNISGSADMYASVYAPTSDVKKTSSAQFYGVIVGGSLTTGGGGGMHYDEALGGIHGAAAQLVK